MSIPLVTAAGCIRGGRLHLHDRRLFDEAVRGLKDGWEVEIELTRFRATRSQKQNAYYHGLVLVALMEYTGITVDVLHDMMKVKFLSKTEVVIDEHGEVVDKVILGTSTRRLTTIEFAEYVDAIRQWAAEKLGLTIPDPDPSWRERSTDGHEEGYGAGV